MDTENLENLWAVAGTIAIVGLTFYRASLKASKSVDDRINDINSQPEILTQSLDISLRQTNLLQGLIDRMDAMQLELNDYKLQLNKLQARNAELEGYKNEQAQQIATLKARVNQLEAELKKNDLNIPEPEDHEGGDLKDGG